MRRGGAWSLACVPVWALASGCVLADPPATLPLVAEYAPDIVTTSVVPSTDNPVTTWPTFIVPVFLSDPTRAIVWKAIVSDSLMSTPSIYGGTQPGGTANPSSGITTINVAIPSPGLNLCATVTVVVAYGWSNSNSNVPDSEGGDRVRWQWQPPGSCPFYDAGALNDATFPDGTTDGS